MPGQKFTAKVTAKVCWVIECSDCGDTGGEDYTPHYPSEAELIEDLTKHAYWTFEKHGRGLCERCTYKADCERDGHQWGPWKQPYVAREDARYLGVLDRTCQHCSVIEETLSELVQGEGR